MVQKKTASNTHRSGGSCNASDDSGNSGRNRLHNPDSHPIRRLCPCTFYSDRVTPLFFFSQPLWLLATMSTENEPLLRNEELGQRNFANDDAGFAAAQQRSRPLHIRSIVWAALGVVFIVGVILALVDTGHLIDNGWSGKLPRDPNLAARRLLDSAPVIVRSCFSGFLCG